MSAVLIVICSAREHVRATGAFCNGKTTAVLPNRLVIRAFLFNYSLDKTVMIVSFSWGNVLVIGKTFLYLLHHLARLKLKSHQWIGDGNILLKFS